MKRLRMTPGRWMALGLCCGLLLGGARIFSNGSQHIGGPGFIDQRTFESELHREPAPSDPRLVGLRLTPGDPVDLVELTYQVTGTDESIHATQVLFAAPIPYALLDHPQTTERVADYLKQQAQSGMRVPIRTNWWDGRPLLLVAIGGAGGVAIIGAMWLSAIPLRLRRPIAAAVMTIPASGDSEAKPGEVGIIPEPAVAPAKVLPTESIAAPAEAPSEPREFVGEYYPVAKQSPHGFSLVELMVVILIITVLITFTMPAARKARDQAQRVACASNLRQLGIALHAYANANQGSLPAWSGWHTWPAGQSDDEMGPAWTIEMIPYLGSPDSVIYNCPAWAGEKRRNYFLEAQWAGRSKRHATKLTDITMTGRFILSGDKTNLDHYPPPMGAGSPQDDADPDDFGYNGCLRWPWAGGFYMHRNGNNVLFDDGHVSLFSNFDAVAMTFNPHRMEA